MPVDAFTSPGTYTWSPPSGVTTVNILIVAGGGSGGGRLGGGGGGGGVIYEQNVSVSQQSYTVTVGEGGSNTGQSGSSPAAPTSANDGDNSSVFGYVAIGGGAGGSFDNADARDGGSGGGAHTYNTSPGANALQPTSSSGGFGYDGGASTGDYAGGGGGGAGAPGDDGQQDGADAGGDGGVGVYYGDVFGDQYGENGYFGAGGGGCSWASAGSNIGLGGEGGGGDGAGDQRAGAPRANGEAGTDGTGGGGGGAGYDGNNWATAGSGGSGVVLIQYAFQPSVDASVENEVLLSWSDVGNDYEYEVYRSETSGNTVSDYTSISTVNTTTYTDTNVEDGEKYYYRINPVSLGPVGFQNLLLWYPFTTDASDESGNGFDGSVNGATYQSSGGPQGTGSYYFDGGDSINIGNPSVDLSGDLSISFWANPATSFNSRRNPVDKAYGGEFSFTFEDDSNYDQFSSYFGSAGSNSNPYRSTPFQNAVFPNTWTHYVWTRDNSSQTVELYINGQKSTNKDNSDSWETPVQSNDDLLIGNGYVSGFYGELTDVRFYDTPLTEQQAQEIYNNTS